MRPASSALRLAPLGLGLGLALGLGACKPAPKYPGCLEDVHCQAGESCVDGWCQACQVDADCGPELACVDFRCQASLALDCGGCEPGLACVDGACQPCTADEACATGVCNASGRCEPPPCATDEACPAAEFCDGGQCVLLATASADPSEAGPCGLAPVYFARDSARLSPTQQQQLVDALPCLREAMGEGGELILEAQVDSRERGAADAAAAPLAERRAETVRAFLLGREPALDPARLRVAPAPDPATAPATSDAPPRSEDRRVTLRVGSN